MIEPIESVMLRTVLQPLIICLQLFAIYVVIHGHYSPGGGFQGGVLLGCSYILPVLVNGIRDCRQLHQHERIALIMAGVGVAIFALVGIIPMFYGEVLLDYAALPIPIAEAAVRRSLGILFVEVGVTLGVAGGMASIFLTLYGNGVEKSP